MSSPLKVALFSFAGAVAIHVSLVACSSGGHGLGASPEGTAHAEPPTGSAAACAQWEVKAFMPSKFEFESIPTVDSSGKPSTISLPVAQQLTLPAGWEPFAGEGYGSVLARHCVE
jgi:hypothetical protein